MIRYSFELSKEAVGDLKRLLDYEGNAFSDLVRVSGASKSHDFIGADLSGVDFSGADLRGYNFSSADLTRAVGRNVLIDGTTLLDNAHTDCSIFAHEAAKRRFLDADPQREALLRKVSQEHWTAGALWAIKNLQKTSKNFKTSAAIARFAYSEIKDITYKNQILYFLRDTFSSMGEYRDFLLGQAAQNNVNFRSLRPIVEILGKQFSRDPVVAQTLLSFLSHEEPEIRAMCVPAVVTRSFFGSNKTAVLSQMRSETSAFVRSAYSQHFCRNHLPACPTLLFRTDESAHHDYAIRINDKIYETLVRGAIRRAKRNARQNDGKNQGISEVKWAELAQGLIGYKPYFQKLIDLGFPLKLTISGQSKMNAPR